MAGSDDSHQDPERPRAELGAASISVKAESVRASTRTLAPPSPQKPGEAPPSGWSGPFSRGEVLGETYEISGILGAGGMGVVYEAHDLLLNRTVAIKVPLREEYAQSLRKEAQAMAAVRHPSLVTIHALGEHRGVAYLVMERVYGMTLEDRVDEAWQSGRPIALEEVLDILLAVTDALTAIHRAGFAHRDIKAANVMLTGTGVAITDFGLVTPEALVQAGEPIAGSADYMAPELILGTVRPGEGPLVDLYALGVMAFEMCAGRRPFAAANLQAVLAAHLEKPPPDVRAIRHDVPPDLGQLVRELMAKTPRERPEGSESVHWRLAALRAALASAPEPPSMSVLIVDDQPEVGAVLKRNLTWSLPRLAVDVATDAETALERIKRHPPDVAVVDLHMPGTNGVELCMAVLALPAHAQPVIVAMSTGMSPADVAVLHSLGVDELVLKDEGFVAHMSAVIGELRCSVAPRSARSAQPARPARPGHSSRPPHRTPRQR
jgi:serine/threonine-protein kinase